MAGQPEVTPAPQPRISVRAQGVSHHYDKGRTNGLVDIDLTLNEGTITGLIGPDGVGKSTLLSLIAGARKLQHGKLNVLHHNMGHMVERDSVLPRIAYMPQGLGKNLYPDLSVTENIDFFGRLFGLSASERKGRISRLLDATGLAPFPDRHAGKLSGGMKQKLGLCCALIHDPDLLILDEPTTGVDPLSRRQFWDLIANMRWQRPRMTVIVATSYMEEASAFDEIVLMDSGRILDCGTPSHLLERTGTATLEEAYIAALPPERKQGHERLVIPPQKEDGKESAIEARDLTRRFGNFTAVDHVSFEIRKGEIFGFIGPNGCGKTTTMKMLTGLLEPSEGESLLFGLPLQARDIKTRYRLGYMSQSFSLYGELTVEQNLQLHARLFQVPKDRREARIHEVIERFDLQSILDQQASAIPLGMRQRLSLAVAVIHKPEVLILDEPTSGVDPIARDKFWALISELSRNDDVTIFISTHFMNEASRCDRIAFMSEGRVLGCDRPETLMQEKGAATLEEAFISYLLEDGNGDDGSNPDELGDISASAAHEGKPRHTPAVSISRLWAYARREMLELSRDRIRLLFSVIVPLFLAVVFGYGISLDVKNLPFAIFDQDKTPESRVYLENFSGSRYFDEKGEVSSEAALDHLMRKGDILLGIEIPSGFGRDIAAGRTPEVAVWIDGSNTFRAETARGFIIGTHNHYLEQLRARSPAKPDARTPARIETRFRYNQDMESVYAIVPGVIGLLLALIPSILTAVAVVREKEVGSIVNLYVTPVSRIEFLLGKQLPYAFVSYMTYIALVAMALTLFGIPLKGSWEALSIGALLYVLATTGFGLVISVFTRTQTAALFAAMILTMLPAMMFSGLIRPVSSLTGGAKLMGTFFPAGYFHHISVGVFTKALGFQAVISPIIALAIFYAVFLALSILFLSQQEK